MPNNGMGMMPMGGAPQMQQNPTPVVENATQNNVPPTITSGGFKKTADAVEFMPAGKVVKTAEQFPDLDDAFDAKPAKGGKGGKKKKKGAVVAAPREEIKAQVIEEEYAFDESTPWKGRPSSFFVMQTASATPEVVDPANQMNLECNDEQWNFIFKYYPEYGSSPYQLITWLFGEAQKNE